MLAGDEISDGPPNAFVHSDDRRELHQMLDRRNGFRISGMEIQITIAHGKDGSATAAHQSARAAEQMVGMI